MKPRQDNFWGKKGFLLGKSIAKSSVQRLVSTENG